jgi:hypothetical protein
MSKTIFVADVISSGGKVRILPSLQAPGRRHTGAVPDVRKNRLTARKSRLETGRRALYDSVRIGARVTCATTASFARNCFN